MAKAAKTNENDREMKIRTTTFIKKGLIEDLDYIASSESLKKRSNISRTEIINEALEDFKRKWEKTNSPIPAK